MLNLSNAMLWISFSPIADVTAEFYHVDSMSVNWLSLVYLIACIPFGVVASWLIDSVGLRASLLTGAVFNITGCVIRLISGMAFVSNHAFLFAMIGQCLCAVAQPFILFAPTKMAATWFPDNQRATANTMASISNPVGILIANIVSPVIVTSVKNVPLMLQIYTGPTALAAVMTIFGVCSSVPPTPPTASAAEISEPFLKGLKKIVKNRPYWIIFVCFGIGMGLFTTISTYIEQILCPRGYSDKFSGLCGALMVGCGILGAGLAGLIVDKTKKFEEVAKIAFLLSALSSIVFSVISKYRDMDVLIAASISTFGFFGFAVYPVVLELGVECTFPISEGTSGGLINMSGQIIGVIIMVVVGIVTPKLPESQRIYSCFTGKKSIVPLDFTYTNIGLSVLAVFGACVFTIFFKTIYRRLRAEQQVAADKILGYPEHGTIYGPVNSR
ncbi:solute carrier family 49 member A3-like isoform X1 [Tubulanus polymorphus]|uniref:solute carrier family 49 member A3-like isoform X1 n=1 Tax=Tubulanus polymorphus TaxID=672921 RepID=UPI003DA3DC53